MRTVVAGKKHRQRAGIQRHARRLHNERSVGGVRREVFVVGWPSDKNRSVRGTAAETTLARQGRRYGGVMRCDHVVSGGMRRERGGVSGKLLYPAEFFR